MKKTLIISYVILGLSALLFIFTFSSHIISLSNYTLGETSPDAVMTNYLSKIFSEYLRKSSDGFILYYVSVYLFAMPAFVLSLLNLYFLKSLNKKFLVVLFAQTLSFLLIGFNKYTLNIFVAIFSIFVNIILVIHLTKNLKEKEE